MSQAGACRLQRRRSPRPHPGPLHSEGQKGGSVGQSRLSASRRLSSASRALCASHVSRAPRASHTSGAPPASPTSCAPSSAGGSGAGSGGVTGESAGEAAGEAAAHPDAGGGGSVRPGKRCPSRARRTVSTRSACVILAARAAGPACAAASAIVCSRSIRSLSALSMRWSARARRARSSVGTGSVRWLRSAIVDQSQRSQGLDCDEGAAPFGAGVARALPFLGKAVGLALQADQAVHALGPAVLGGSRTRAASCARDRSRTVAAPRTDARHDLVHGSAVLDRCSHGVLDCARQRLVR